MSQPNWKRPAALAGALFALGSAAYWLEFSHKPKKEEAESLEKRAFRINDSAVKSIRIVEGSRAFEFRCLDLDAKLCKPGDNSKWEVVEPLKFRADDSNVNSLLSSLNNLDVAESIDLSSETPEKRNELLIQYRLDSEALASENVRKVEVVLADDRRTVLNLGDTHPIGDNIFSLRSDSDQSVFLIPSYFKSNFDKNLDHWRNKKLLTLASHEIKRFELNGTQAKASGERKDGQWIIRTSLKGKADEFTGDDENINSLLSAASYLTAKSFAAEKKDGAEGKKALSGARRILTLTVAKADEKPEEGKTPAAAAESSEPVTLALYEKKQGKSSNLFATVSTLDPVYELDTGAKDRLDKSLKDLRLAKLITSMDRFAAKKLSFEGAQIGAEPFVLVNKDSKWQTESGSPEIQVSKVQEVLDKLSGNRIQEFLVGPKIPRGEASGLTVSLWDDKTDVRRKLVFWQAKDKLYARDLLSKREEAFAVDSSIRDSLPWDREFFEKTEESTAESDENQDSDADGDGDGEHDGHDHGGDDHGHAH